MQETSTTSDCVVVFHTILKRMESEIDAEGKRPQPFEPVQMTDRTDEPRIKMAQFDHNFITNPLLFKFETTSGALVAQKDACQIQDIEDKESVIIEVNKCFSPNTQVARITVSDFRSLYGRYRDC